MTDRLIKKVRVTHRKQRDRSPWPGMMLHQDGSHYWHTPKAGGKVDKVNLSQFGRAMGQLGIEMIPAYSPEARGRSERVFSTHQDRLVKELALAIHHGPRELARYDAQGQEISKQLPVAA